MSDHDIDWKRNNEHYLYAVLGHYAVFDRPDRKLEHCSPMQRVTRQIKKLRGERYWDRIEDGGHSPLRKHESWFQMPAQQKEERLLRRVDWSGSSRSICAPNADIATAMSEGCVAMQASLAPRNACVRLKPRSAAQPAPGVRLLQWDASS